MATSPGMVPVVIGNSTTVAASNWLVAIHSGCNQIAGTTLNIGKGVHGRAM
jgi:hypothetical protein